MENLIAIAGQDFTLLASDTQSTRSILIQKPSHVDRILPLTPHAVLAFAGPPGDAVHFAEYVQKNMKLHGIRTGLELSPKACASFARRELADALRSRSSYQVGMIIAGYDTRQKSPAIYWLDHLATAISNPPYAVHGYASHFCLATLDRHYRPDMTLEQAVEVLKKCLNELKTRFLVKLDHWTVKVVDERGTRVVEEDLVL